MTNPTPTEWRALCAELMDAIDSGISVERIKQSPLAVRVDAALAQRKPQGPMDEELVEQWVEQWGFPCKPHDLYQHIATQAAQWGADQELEACCDYIRDYQYGFVDLPDGSKRHRAVDLELARRPKPSSLKKQALALIDDCTDPENDYLDDNALSIIRRALESIND